MLTAAANEMLTHIGPGTPMGELMREYWIPACLLVGAEGRRRADAAACCSARS